MYESLIQILGNPISRQTLGMDAVLVLTLLVQYRKYEVRSGVINSRKFCFKLGSVFDFRKFLTFVFKTQL